MLEALPREWPGVADPDALRDQLAEWLSQYANAGTRRTYAYALGLPIAWVDPAAAPVTPPSRLQQSDTAATGEQEWHPAAVGATPAGAEPRGARPPAAAPGPLHHLAWFRWCAARDIDPRAVSATHVKAWLHALDAAGAQPRTRRRMLSTLSALYGHLAESGVIAANPAALNRARLGLAGSARDASPTVRLTAPQVAALLVAAARPTVRGRYARLHATRAVAFVALLTLGLRISEITGLDRADRYRSGGEDVLRVLGKGGVHREVYVTDPVRDALAAYLAERDALTGAATPVRRGRTGADPAPLLATRAGGRCSRVDLYTQLRRIAVEAGPALDGVADRIHPHALRHAYVTIALDRDAPIQDVQADVGHATIATTQHYDRGLRRRAASAADLVADALDL